MLKTRTEIFANGPQAMLYIFLHDKEIYKGKYYVFVGLEYDNSYSL